jgi:hypothetical protein
MTPFVRCEREPKSERIDVDAPGLGVHACCGGTDDDADGGPETAMPLDTGGGVRLGTGGGPYADGGGVCGCRWKRGGIG